VPGRLGSPGLGRPAVGHRAPREAGAFRPWGLPWQRRAGPTPPRPVPPARTSRAW
jgi:hypothetical protein